MKRLFTIILLWHACLVLPAQSPSFRGGSADGYGVSALSAASAFNLYKGGTADGYGASSLTSMFAFNLYKGGSADGFAFSDGYSPVSINIYKGGAADGYAYSAQAAATAFSFYNGGAADGYAAGQWGGSAPPAPVCSTVVLADMSVGSLTTTTVTLHYTSGNYLSTSVLQLQNTVAGTSVYYNLPATTAYQHSQPVSGLAPATAYQWRVKEYCTTGDSSAYSPWHSFTTPAVPGGSCAAPTAQGVHLTSGQVLIGKWTSPLYGNSSLRYQVSFGMNIASPAQGTIGGSTYHISQTSLYATHFFATGNQPGFTWYVRDICAAGDTSPWAGPYVMGSSKTDETAGTIPETGAMPEGDWSVKMYPNPTAGQPLTIEVSGHPAGYRYTIYNLQGAIVLEGTLQSSQHRLSVQHLPAGTYALQVQGSGHSVVHRLIIQH